MAYVINLTNGQQLTTVEDGTIDQSTTIKLVGKNYAGYGEIQNENFVHLMENFSSANAPANPLSGQMWFDSSSSKLKFYDGSKFRTTGGAEVSSSQPVGLATGDFWWDTDNNQLYAQNSDGGFVLIGPDSIGDSVSAMVTKQVRDNNATNRTVIQGTVNDAVMFIISASEFTIDSTDPQNAITGFDVVRQGLTLRNTTSGTDGVTADSTRFHGTATNAERLGGVAATNFVRNTPGEESSFDEIVRFSDTGLTVGAANDGKIYIDTAGTGDELVCENTVGKKIRFIVKSTGGVSTEPLHISAAGIIPTATTTYDIGTTSLKFRNIYATAFNGLATNATNLQVGTNYRTGDVNATNNTVAVRDSSGNLAANVFNGISTSARYADLAEKYTTEAEHKVGTIMAVCVHEDHETAPANAGDIIIGVVSDKPAYLMNADADGQALALKGRVPVRVIGRVQKGDPIYTVGDGIGAADAQGGLVGVALESNSDTAEKLVECVLKV